VCVFVFAVASHRATQESFSPLAAESWNLTLAHCDLETFFSFILFLCHKWRQKNPREGDTPKGYNWFTFCLTLINSSQLLITEMTAVERLIFVFICNFFSLSLALLSSSLHFYNSHQCLSFLFEFFFCLPKPAKNGFNFTYSGV
jgi:hypothetical protein